MRHGSTSFGRCTLLRQDFRHRTCGTWILFGLFFVLIGLVGLATAPGQQKLGIVGILIIAGLSPFIYRRPVIGAVGALFYNWIASAIGGLEMELDAVHAPDMAAAPSPPEPSPAV